MKSIFALIYLFLGLSLAFGAEPTTHGSSTQESAGPSRLAELDGQMTVLNKMAGELRQKLGDQALKEAIGIDDYVVGLIKLYSSTFPGKIPSSLKVRNRSDLENLQVAYLATKFGSEDKKYVLDKLKASENPSAADWEAVEPLYRAFFVAKRLQSDDPDFKKLDEQMKQNQLSREQLYTHYVSLGIDSSEYDSNHEKARELSRMVADKLGLYEVQKLQQLSEQNSRDHREKGLREMHEAAAKLKLQKQQSDRALVTHGKEVSDRSASCDGLPKNSGKDWDAVYDCYQKILTDYSKVKEVDSKGIAMIEAGCTAGKNGETGEQFLPGAAAICIKEGLETFYRYLKTPSDLIDAQLVAAKKMCPILINLEKGYRHNSIQCFMMAGSRTEMAFTEEAASKAFKETDWIKRGKIILEGYKDAGDYARIVKFNDRMEGRER